MGIGADSEVGWLLGGGPSGGVVAGGVDGPCVTGGCGVSPDRGAWQVIFGVGAGLVGVADGVTVFSPDGQVLPFTTCLPVFEGRIVVGLGEPLGTGSEESLGRTSP